MSEGKPGLIRRRNRRFGPWALSSAVLLPVDRHTELQLRIFPANNCRFASFELGSRDNVYRPKFHGTDPDSSPVTGKIKKIKKFSD